MTNFRKIGMTKEVFIKLSKATALKLCIGINKLREGFGV